jgi:coenzyme F420-0:L-glutamate ligase/coenzyme F420-1:gamma-L-glutamate ligase
MPLDGPTFLAALQARQSVRAFRPDPVERAVLERLFAAAVSAPSPTNRQPWRFAVVTAASVRARVVEVVHARVAEMGAIIERGHHKDDFGRYGDFFHEPLAAAPVIVVPSYRSHTDLIAALVRSGGGDPSAYDTSAAMQSELCAAAAATMNLLNQAAAEGLGATWMAGPMVARAGVEALVGIRAPFRMLGAVALGWPAEQPSPKPRRPLEQVVTWLDAGD